MSNTLKAHLAIIGANLIFGINYTISKDIMPDYVHPFALTLMRSITGVIGFWLLSLFIPNEKIQKKDLLTFDFCRIFLAWL